MGTIRATAAAATAVVIAIGLAGCSGDGDDSASSVGESAATMIAPDAPADASGGVAEQATAGSAAPSTPLGLDSFGRAIAVEAGVTITTTDIRRAVDDTLTVVARNGGAVFNADVNIGDKRDDDSTDGFARIVVKVPPTELDALIADLDGTAGTLVGRSQDAEDVTDRLVDLDIRIRVEQHTIERFEKLLADATQLADVIEIQRVISEHTITLEQLRGAERDLDRRVELSTLTIELQYSPPAPEVIDDDSDGIAHAFALGWEAFLGALFTVALVLAILAPFLAVGAVVGAIVWFVVRRQARRSRERAARHAATGDVVSDRDVDDHAHTSV